MKKKNEKMVLLLNTYDVPQPVTMTRVEYDLHLQLYMNIFYADHTPAAERIENSPWSKLIEKNDRIWRILAEQYGRRKYDVRQEYVFIREFTLEEHGQEVKAIKACFIKLDEALADYNDRLLHDEIMNEPVEETNKRFYK